MEKRTKALIILVALTIIFTIIGGTLAYFQWSSVNEQKTNVTFTVASGFSCSADGGGSINNNSGTLAPSSCTNSTYAFQRTIKANVVNNREGNIYLDMWLTVNSIDSGLANSDNFKYALTTNSSSCTQDVVSSGTFKGTSANDKVYILDGKSYATTTNNDTFYLYVWLDAAETNSNTMNQNFSLSLGGECSDVKKGQPVLEEGMIPVKISNTGVVTAVAETDDTWFNYGNKQWANAVLVKENGVKTRSANKNDLTTINPSDILAYFVWIPRYSYKVWQYTGVSDTGQEREIDIKFVGTRVTETAIGNNQYYTHPAFDFGGSQLAGFWVGKFETSASTSSNCYSYPDENCNSIQSMPRILPNVDSLRYQKIGNQYQTAMVFSGGTMDSNTYMTSYSGSSTFGLTANTDSHMMKNSEWGAVAYLSHSKYGINTEIRKNNFESAYGAYRRLTGCGADSANANVGTSVTTCAIPYGTISGETFDYPQSTTGNISGVFDMAGGAYDRVMGHYGTTGDSYGFAAAWFTTSSNSKYFNLYDSSVFAGTLSTNITFCTLVTCGGHALNETKLWHSNSATFANSNNLWFVRGGNDDDSAAGVFSSGPNSGFANAHYSFRVVLANNIASYD